MNVFSLGDILAIEDIFHSYNSILDRDMLGDILHREDRDKDWALRIDNYLYYHAICQHLKPRIIAEIGVRRGYSAKSMIMGAWNGDVKTEDIHYYGHDNECYIRDSLSHVRQYLAGRCGMLSLVRVDTQTKDDLAIRFVDVFNVDGDHSEEGTRHDMDLAWLALRPGGVMLIDDVQAGKGTVYPAVIKFCRDRGTFPFFIPNYRGLFLIQKG